MTNEQIATDNIILMTEGGSRVHGLAVASSDTDDIGIFVEPRSHVYGFEPPIDSVDKRDRPMGVRSEPGDYELKLYSLRKFAALAAKGNPSVLLPLYAPDESVKLIDSDGLTLRQNRDLFLSKSGIKQFLGYMRNQHERMLGSGKQSKVPNRPELVEKFGYDTKYAAHALRLSFQGHEYASYGTLTLPMPEEQRSLLLQIRNGEHTLESVSQLVLDNIEQVEALLESSRYPDSPPRGKISALLVRIHEHHWNHSNG